MARNASLGARRSRAWLPALGAALGVLACAPEEGPDGAPARPRNLVLLVVDTLRADAVGWAGYPRPTTPVLDGLAERSVVFEQAVAQSSWTRASMASLVTGLWPSTTGLTCHHFRTPEGSCDVLRASLPTLGERFAGAGFATAGVVANPNVDPVFGFDQGFEHYVCVPAEIRRADPDGHSGEGGLRATTEAVTRAALDWLGARDPGRPFLLYLHYLDPHEPYDPPEERRAAFPAADYDLDPRAREPRARYDAEIAFVDAEIGRVLDALDAAGLTGSTAVLVVSDHGEEFYEHGGTYHGWTLYDEQVRVPLLLHLPGLPARRVAEQVRQIDVLPTLLDAFGLPVPGELQGRSLMPLARGEAGASLPALSEWGYSPLSSLRAPPWKLVHDHETGRSRLYDLAADPGETTDLAEERPDVAAELLGRLLALRAEAARAGERYAAEDAEVELSEEKVRQLRALGYGD